MSLSLIVAATTNNVIGKNNDLPWRLPNDMKYFKNTTWGMPVIMGRKTFQSMTEPLAGRTNIVITRQTNWKPEGAVVVNNLSDALFVAKDADSKEVFVIGGGEIFKDAIKKADRIYMTRIHTILDGDAHFPEIEEKKWKLISKRDCFADEKHKFDYSFEVWERD
ncbi:dihydrofolate reductase [Segetibacter aerophilus]|uniref:Dihydrofolate reductase n=1 Tax=Segetibacter aerophilus TaxID=670293 RepID=A0A512B9H1_9BACT|nr:dihydrofolate reductase [Segetibacter aerophilus]GEO08602.1 dihydrofolate reductase [Segetibacter aerophilus]